MRWASIILALLVGALGGVVAGYALGSDAPLGDGALSLAAATIGGLIALAGAFGIQLRKDHRDDVQARRARQEAVMIASHRRLVEIRQQTLTLSKQRAHGRPLSSAIEIDAARSFARPELEMIDDDTIRRLAVDALNGFALTAEAIAPNPPKLRRAMPTWKLPSIAIERRSTQSRHGSAISGAIGTATQTCRRPSRRAPRSRRPLRQLVPGARRHVEQQQADHGFAARAQHRLDAGSVRVAAPSFPGW